MKNFLFIVISFPFLSLNLIAQDSFFSKFYFPNTYGLNYPIFNNHLKSNFIVSFGLEYRFEKKTPYFMRFSSENFWLEYSIKNGSQTNASQSKLTINGFYFGPGLRKNMGKWKFLLLAQTGFVNYMYPIVENTYNSYKVTFSRNNSFSCQAVLGVEYYLSKKFALTCESYYIIIPNANSFWKSNFENAGFRFGINTSIF